MRIKECGCQISTLAVVLFASCLLSACGVVNRTAYLSSDSASVGTSLPVDTIQGQLYTAHEQWKGTPYVLGGSGTGGVDCSSFMQIVFDDYFGLSMPRHTSEQLQVGQGIRRNDIQSGDLIFFRTTRTGLHVGVAVNMDEFLHASTSSGVMISSLAESYWSTRYLGARRVFL